MAKRKEPSELYVITKTKDLCTYVFTITDKSPKKFRFTFIARLQNMSLEILQNLYYANMVYVRNSNDTARIEKRKDYQQAVSGIVKTDTEREGEDR